MLPDSEKITIRSEDLPPPAAPAERIVIAEADLPFIAKVAGTETPVVHAVLLDDAPATANLPAVVWIAATLVPFFNAWIWWRYAPADPPQRNLFRAGACLLGGLSLLGSALLVALVALVEALFSHIER